ncbi:MAG: hypothetical protein OXG44_12690 [Gammaproteobacteria bacterium]|nr:hypothetical protein [Gammaproteobacteria bacterium]
MTALTSEELIAVQVLEATSTYRNTLAIMNEHRPTWGEGEIINCAQKCGPYAAADLPELAAGRGFASLPS